MVNGVDFSDESIDWNSAVDSVMFKENKNDMSYVDIILSVDPMRITKGTKWYTAANVFSANNLYKKDGSIVEVHIGYKGSDNFVDFEGVCVTLKPNYPDEQSPNFQITAYDYSVFMNQVSKKEKSYQGMQIKNLIEEICSRYKDVIKETEIDEIPKLNLSEDDQIFKDSINQTDRDWLVTIANKINFLFYVRGKKLYFKSIDKIQPTEEALLYRPSLSRPADPSGIILKLFEPKADIMNIVNNIKVESAPLANYKVSAEASEIAKGMGKNKVEQMIFSVFGERMAYTFTNCNDEKDAKQAAAELLSSQALNFMSGYGELKEGNQRLRLGQLRNMELNGLGVVDNEFSGQYLISMTQHTIDSNGYSTEFEIQRNALGEEYPVEARGEVLGA